ncbi:hypothetical protein ACYEXS_23600 [Paenibacillus sp. MAH-36]|uniref:Uncharacterized protein n=1 Tax=Paenibacillus violae TaxID=3077234 RepID=A0ABU3RNL0_9BACL|nr:hypothetical protein [Paenibacillus sp. PFR10]MDU0205808.1 hypothetical protein [Paenibacillus sp. PFR10]
MDMPIHLFESIAMKWSKKADVEMQEHITLAASVHAERLAEAARKLESDASLPSAFDVIFGDSDDDEDEY